MSTKRMKLGETLSKRRCKLSEKEVEGLQMEKVNAKTFVMFQDLIDEVVGPNDSKSDYVNRLIFDDLVRRGKIDGNFSIFRNFKEDLNDYYRTLDDTSKVVLVLDIVAIKTREHLLNCLGKYLPKIYNEQNKTIVNKLIRLLASNLGLSILQEWARVKYKEDNIKDKISSIMEL